MRPPQPEGVAVVSILRDTHVSSLDGGHHSSASASFWWPPLLLLSDIGSYSLPSRRAQLQS